MDLLRKFRKSMDIVSTPTAPKMGRIPLPEVEGGLYVNLQAAKDADDGASSASDRTPSPVTPLSRHRKPSLFARSPSPRVPSRPTTPICAMPPPELVAPTPKWRTAETLRETGWRNVGSPAPTPVEDEDDIDVIKRRNRALSMQAPPRASSSRHSERLSPELWKDKLEKPRATTPQAPSRTSTSRSYSPDVPLKPSRKSQTPAHSERQYDSDYAPSARAASRVSSGSSRSAARPAPVKGILKPSKPSPVDMEKLAACGRDTPAPSPPPQSPIFAKDTQFLLHWQLLPPNPAVQKSIVFDVALPLDFLRKRDHTGVPLALGALDEGKLALEGAPYPLKSMNIRIRGLERWPVRVQAASKKGVTCGEVFAKVHEVLDAPLTEEEQMKYVNDKNRARVEAAFAQRCKDMPALDGYVRQQGLKRVDLLCGKRMFGGLCLDQSTQWDLWELTMCERMRA